jgi:hypothetical protein
VSHSRTAPDTTDNSHTLRDRVIASGASRTITFTSKHAGGTTLGLFLSVIAKAKLDFSLVLVPHYPALFRLFAFMKAHNCDLARKVAVLCLRAEHRFRDDTVRLLLKEVDESVDNTVDDTADPAADDEMEEDDEYEAEEE